MGEMGGSSSTIANTGMMYSSNGSNSNLMYSQQHSSNLVGAGNISANLQTCQYQQLTSEHHSVNEEEHSQQLQRYPSFYLDPNYSASSNQGMNPIYSGFGSTVACSNPNGQKAFYGLSNETNTYQTESNTNGQSYR